jgi:signal transduction histidine kinase
VLVAVATVAVAGAATAGGFLLHHAAGIERQALRTQRLGSAAFQLQDVVSLVESAGGITPQLEAERKRVLMAGDDAYRSIRAHDDAEGNRIGASYTAYIRAATSALDQAGAGGGRLPAAQQQHRLERQLADLESRIDAEVQRLARDSRVTNPRARLALVIALAAAVVLVGLLIWQFEMQRRAGRIDRDNARRSEELIRLRDEFVASVSHELRTPLTSILGYLELIREKEADTQATEDGAFLEIVARNADRLLRLVSDLLLVAEVEGGMLNLQLREVELGALAAECVEAAKPDAERRQISLTLRRESAASLAADPMRLAQMMDNVVSNAIKFTPTGGRVTVAAGSHDGHAVFAVSDTGPGISPADQAHLFDPFFRTRAAQTQGIKGTGLGLTITKAIVDAHHGSIEVESSPGTGTTFQIELPLTRG